MLKGLLILTLLFPSLGVVTLPLMFCTLVFYGIATIVQTSYGPPD